ARNESGSALAEATSAGHVRPTRQACPTLQPGGPAVSLMRLVAMSAPFSPGELALLLDGQGNRHLLRLAEGETLHHHLGAVRHSDVIGRPNGAVIRSHQGAQFAAV